MQEIGWTFWLTLIGTLATVIGTIVACSVAFFKAMMNFIKPQLEAIHENNKITYKHLEEINSSHFVHLKEMMDNGIKMANHQINEVKCDLKEDIDQRVTKAEYTAALNGLFAEIRDGFKHVNQRFDDLRKDK